MPALSLRGRKTLYDLWNSKYVISLSLFSQKNRHLKLFLFLLLWSKDNEKNYHYDYLMIYKDVHDGYRCDADILTCNSVTFKYDLMRKTSF